MKEINEFDRDDMQALCVPMKLGLLATIDPQGSPHVTLLSTLQPCGAHQMTWGQFVEGLSKSFIRKNPKTGFMIMTLDKSIWRGKAHFKETRTSGPEYDMYNDIPMFRYNAYFGIHTVYYMDLVHHYGREPLPMAKIITGALLTILAKTFSAKTKAEPSLNRWTYTFMNKLDNLKFVCFIDQDGYPRIIPAIQAQAADHGRLVFACSPYADELALIPPRSRLAVFAMSLQMEAVLMRGTYHGIRRIAGIPCGELDVDWVYNAMPPVPGQIYPPQPLEKVRNFI